VTTQFCYFGKVTFHAFFCKFGKATFIREFPLKLINEQQSLFVTSNTHNSKTLRKMQDLKLQKLPEKRYLSMAFI